MGTGRFGSLDVQPESKLRAVLEISRALAGTMEVEKILPRILDTLFTVFTAADRGCILIRDESQNMIPKAIKHRREGEDESVKLSRTILKKVIDEKTGILSADATSDSRFQASESISNFTIRSMMCVPLLAINGDVLGVINIDTQNPIKQFKDEDLDLLMVVASQAALSYETARLIASYTEKQKQDSEMKIAARVQRALLPEDVPVVAGWQFYASYESAQAVGGDYYDIIRLTEDKVCLAFGDVAGKGVPASLVMSRISAVVQNTMEFVQEAPRAVERINHHMCVNAVEGRFVTFVLVIIDTKTHEMTLVNAGHMSPIIRRVDGTPEEFPEDIVGLPIGVVDDVPFEGVTRVVAPGETVVIYTDGVSEAMDARQNLYGLDRLRSLITAGANGAADPKALGEKILADVKTFAGGYPQNDDITLMAFGRLPE
jgi:sigma-B regulation protein RsbU (phosphoserine phosphatase)